MAWSIKISAMTWGITNPKIITTKYNAEYGAKTLDVKLGEEIGYKFSGSSSESLSDKSRLLYITDGLIVAIILGGDTLLKDYIGVIIDEAHERKIQIDLLLYLIKNAIKIRQEQNLKPLKLIIMSATINEKIFAQYYKEFAYDYMFLSGTPNYPIETIYLESPLDIKSNKYIEEGKKTVTEIVRKIKRIGLVIINW